MAKLVLKDAYVAVNGTAIYNHVSSVTIESQFDEVDLTGFGANADGAKYREFGQGIGDATITLAVFQDYEPGSIDDIFWPLSQSGGTCLIEVRPTTARASASNPSYRMTGRLFSFNPLAGAVGDASTTDVTIRNAGTAGIARGTA